MSVSKEAIGRFTETYPQLEIRKAYDYDGESYIFMAMEPGITEDFNDPFFLVAKNGLYAKHFVPFFDIAAFTRALDHELPISR